MHQVSIKTLRSTKLVRSNGYSSVFYLLLLRKCEIKLNVFYAAVAIFDDIFAIYVVELE